MAADIRYHQFVAEDAVLRDLRTCSSDAQCGIWQASLQCAGTQFSKLSCPRGVRADQRATASARLAEVTAELCANVAPTCSVGDVPCTAPVGVRCVDGTCRTFIFPDGGALGP